MFTHIDASRCDISVCVCVLKAAHVGTWWEQASWITLSSKWDGDTWSAKVEELKWVGGNELLSHERWRPGEAAGKARVETARVDAEVQKEALLTNCIIYLYFYVSHTNTHTDSESTSAGLRCVTGLF